MASQTATEIIIRDRAALDETGGNADTSPMGWVHYCNHGTMNFIRESHAAGCRFLNVYDENAPIEAELRFADLLDADGWMLHTTEFRHNLWHWSASDAAGARIPEGEWHRILLQARG